MELLVKDWYIGVRHGLCSRRLVGIQFFVCLLDIIRLPYQGASTEFTLDVFFQ